jgi:hypothetical protein
MTERKRAKEPMEKRGEPQTDQGLNGKRQNHGSRPESTTCEMRRGYRANKM